MIAGDNLIGVLVIRRRGTGDYPCDVVELLETFASQSALAIVNARLFRELEIQSRELEIASNHKSEFLASMSHELRTPLNAVIGFSEVLLERMFGEINERQEEYLRDIWNSGRHLLELLNEILDLCDRATVLRNGRVVKTTELASLTEADLTEAMIGGRSERYRRGGAVETVVEGETGLFFEEQTAESLMDALTRFEAQIDGFDPAAIRRHAQAWNRDIFKERLQAFITAQLREAA